MAERDRFDKHALQLLIHSLKAFINAGGDGLPYTNLLTTDSAFHWEFAVL